MSSNTNFDVSNKFFYITTPIYYPNSSPHIGHAYTTIIADIINRYEKFFGKNTFFSTGTDEHGQKILQAANKEGTPVKEYIDKIVSEFKEAWKELGVNPNIFIRTTDDFHEKIVKESLQKLYDKGEIYKKGYSGWYCVSEEIFYTEKDLINGKTSTGKEVIFVTEENYFFKMSLYQQRLIDYINENPDYIRPENRRQEVLGFLKEPLGDLCISRPKSRVSWGIELPFDTEYVVYVWFDALLNYISSIDYGNQEKNQFNNFWKESHHLIGKDILITHAIYWSTMLMALGISLPKQIFAHGWWLNSEGKKMSKSEGDVVAPLNMKEIFGSDAFRYYMCRGVKFGSDLSFDIERAKEKLNDELANNYGNLASRVFKLVHKDFEGKIPVPQNILNDEAKKILEMATTLYDQVYNFIENLDINEAVLSIMNLLKATNKFFGDLEPWKCKKNNEDEKEAECLFTACEVVRIASILLSPVMPESTKKILDALNVKEKESYLKDTQSLRLNSVTIKEITPIFKKY